MIRRVCTNPLLATLMAFVLCAGCAAGPSVAGAPMAGASQHRALVATPAPGTFSLLVEPDQGIEPVYRVIASARRTVDLTMYELTDPAAEQALDEAAGRGVAVRVILDKNREQAANQSAYDGLRRHGVHVTWASDRYLATHAKALVVDHSVAAILSLNLTSRYYSDTRDFAVLDLQVTDVEAIEQVFDADFRHDSITMPPGYDLVWSPGAEPALLQVVKSATTNLLVENEEMALPAMTDALASAARRGVHVTVVMTRQADWAHDFDELVAAGADVRTYPANGSLYIHAKVIVADTGTTRARAFVGSQNFSAASLQHNRELGVLTADPALIAGLSKTIAGDAAAASPWITGAAAH